jgi:hypothetical protein
MTETVTGHTLHLIREEIEVPLRAEIERLREQVASLQASSGYEASIAQVEIARLRAALRGLLDEVMCFAVDPPSAALNHAIEQAHAALEPKP